MKSRRVWVLSLVVHGTLYHNEARGEGGHWPVLGGEEWMAMLAILVGHAAPYLARTVQVVWAGVEGDGFLL
jgi:hypothetical protein